MDANQIQQVLREVFGSISTEVSNGWVKISCPFSRYLHARGSDSRPSAGISFGNENGKNIFSCFSCGVKLPLHAMLSKWAGYTGEDVTSLVEEIEEEAYLGPREIPGWDAVEEEEEEQAALSKAIYLDLYDSAEGHPYLRKRGISAKTAKKLQLMVDPEDRVDGEERILFPVFGADGSLHGFTGRATSSKARTKVRDYFGFQKRKNLLGAHLISGKVDKVVVVEGPFDYAKAWECGVPAVAVLHSSLTAYQVDILSEFNRPIYLFSDNDLAGDKIIREALKIGANRWDLRLLSAKYPSVWIEDEQEESGGHWAKDVGELNKSELLDMVARADFIKERKWSGKPRTSKNWY